MRQSQTEAPNTTNRPLGLRAFGALKRTPAGRALKRLLSAVPRPHLQVPAAPEQEPEAVTEPQSVVDERQQAARAVAAEEPQQVEPLPKERPQPGILTEEMLRLNELYALQHGVEPIVHPHDFIYFFCVRHPKLPLDYAIWYYFSTGANSAQKLDELAASLPLDHDRPIRLLEFASGYGGVSRHLKNNPRFDLVSCDIHPAAIAFLRESVGVKALQSAHTPEGFIPCEKYDVVFALSFFSHMPKRSFGRGSRRVTRPWT